MKCQKWIQLHPTGFLQGGRVCLWRDHRVKGFSQMTNKTKIQGSQWTVFWTEISLNFIATLQLSSAFQRQLKFQYLYVSHLIFNLFHLTLERTVQLLSSFTLKLLLVFTSQMTFQLLSLLRQQLFIDASFPSVHLLTSSLCKTVTLTIQLPARLKIKMFSPLHLLSASRQMIFSTLFNASTSTHTSEQTCQPSFPGFSNIFLSCCPPVKYCSGNLTFF